MNNPGHNNTFNKDAERIERDEQPRLEGLMNLSSEFADPNAELHQHVPSKELDIVTNDAVGKVEKLLPQAINPKPVSIPRDGRTYRNEVDTNEDSSPNVMAPKE